jgi:hypothetical protein
VDCDFIYDWDTKHKQTSIAKRQMPHDGSDQRLIGFAPNSKKFPHTPQQQGEQHTSHHAVDRERQADHDAPPM